MSEAYQQILNLLPKATPEERQKLKVLVSNFKGDKSVVNGSQGRYLPGNVFADGDWLFEGIVGELSRRGIVYPKHQIIATQKIVSSYEDNSAFVRLNLEKALKLTIPKPRRVQLEALGNASARALAEYLSPVVASLGLKLLMNNVGKTFEALDRSFPGYLGSGMIGVLIQREVLGDAT